jgi:hypothetical protein
LSDEEQAAIDEALAEDVPGFGGGSSGGGGGPPIDEIQTDDPPGGSGGGSGGGPSEPEPEPDPPDSSGGGSGAGSSRGGSGGGDVPPPVGDIQTDDPPGGSDGGQEVAEARQQDIDAALGEDVESVSDQQQGVETGGQFSEQARELEQQVLDANPTLDAADVRVERDGDTLRTALTAQGAEQVGRNPSIRDQEQAIRDARPEGTLGPTREADIELRPADPAPAEGVISTGIGGDAEVRRTQSTPATDGAQPGSRDELFGGTSATEEALRDASAAFSDTVDTIASGGRDTELTLPTTFGGTVSVDTETNPVGRAISGTVRGAGEVANLPGLAVTGIEAGEVAVAGGRAALRSDLSEFGADVTPLAEFGADVERGGGRLVQQVERQARADPIGFGGQLVGGAVGGTAALTGARAAGGARAASAADALLDPAQAAGRGARLVASRARRRARAEASDFLADERAELRPDGGQRVRGATEAGEEALLEIEADSEAEAEAAAAREEFLERTRIRDEPGDIVQNQALEDIDVAAPSRARETRVDTESADPTDRIPPRSEFESEAAFERELERARERIEQEQDSTQTAAAGDVDAAVEAPAAVLGATIGGSGTTAGATDTADVEGAAGAVGEVVPGGLETAGEAVADVEASQPTIPGTQFALDEEVVVGEDITVDLTQDVERTDTTTQQRETTTTTQQFGAETAITTGAERTQGAVAPTTLPDVPGRPPRPRLPFEDEEDDDERVQPPQFTGDRAVTATLDQQELALGGADEAAVGGYDRALEDVYGDE